MIPHPEGIPSALFAYDPGVKPETPARAKAMVRYGPGEGERCYWHLTDLSRLLLVFANCVSLQAGLEHIMQSFEVVDIRNFFEIPTRLGLRFVEVLVVMHVGDGAERVPHICEIRLEEVVFHKAQEQAAPLMEQIFTGFRKVFDSRMSDEIIALVHSMLSKPCDVKALRVLRCHLGKRFGSTVWVWRRMLGNGKRMDFQQFRKICHEINCGDQATFFWQHLDPGLSGNISLFEFDPTATALLNKFRLRLLSSADPNDDGDHDAVSLFNRLSFMVKPHRVGHLEPHEWRPVCRACGLTVEEADLVFTHLDYAGGGHATPPASLTPRDLQWLLDFPKLVDVDSVMLKSGLDEMMMVGVQTRRVRYAGSEGLKQDLQKRINVFLSEKATSELVAEGISADTKLTIRAMRSLKSDASPRASPRGSPRAHDASSRGVRMEGHVSARRDREAEAAEAKDADEHDHEDGLDEEDDDEEEEHEDTPAEVDARPFPGALRRGDSRSDARAAAPTLEPEAPVRRRSVEQEGTARKSLEVDAGAARRIQEQDANRRILERETGASHRSFLQEASTQKRLQEPEELDALSDGEESVDSDTF